MVAITGPRQSGKTTLAQSCFPDLPYASLENPIEAAHFDEDAEGFLRRHPDGVILDEVQNRPVLFSFIQGIVDRDQRPGRFILTGSTNFSLMEGITQSLAGRVGLVELLPFDRAELSAVGVAADDLEETLIRGAYPPVYDRPITPSRWYADYLATYVQRDVRQVLQVRDLATFTSFVRLCAAQVGQEVNYQRWGGDLGIDGKTLRAWLSVLEASYIVVRLPPHHRSFRKRVVKTPKLYFVDTGLLCRLLDITEHAHLVHHPLRGAIFESWVISELIKGRLHRGERANISFWRSHDGLEVDALAERGLELTPLEIKVTSTFRPELAAGLARWRAVAGDAARPGYLVYGGTQRRETSRAIFIPWSEVGSLAARL